MQRRIVIAGLAAVLMSAALGSSVCAGDVRTGATLHVAANSIWFQDAGQLSRWQQLKGGGDAEALAAYQDQALGERDAWQFTAPLEVKVLGYEAETHQVHVEMQTPGRMLGTDWFVDEGALLP